MTPNDKVGYIFDVTAKTAFTQNYDFEKNQTRRPILML